MDYAINIQDIIQKCAQKVAMFVQEIVYQTTGVKLSHLKLMLYSIVPNWTECMLVIVQKRGTFHYVLHIALLKIFTNVKTDDDY